MRAGRKDPNLVVDVKRSPDMLELNFDPREGLTLGAAVPCYRIYGNATVKKLYPSLVEVSSIIGGTQIQGRASIGGNLCNAAPSADSVPLLIALGVKCRIASAGGTREVPAEDFCTAPGQNVLRPGELLVSLRFPPPAAGTGEYYLRFTPRNEMDIAVAGAGVSVELDNGAFRSARIALAAVALVVMAIILAPQLLGMGSQPSQPAVITSPSSRRCPRPARHLHPETTRTGIAARSS